MNSDHQNLKEALTADQAFLSLDSIHITHCLSVCENIVRKLKLFTQHLLKNTDFPSSDKNSSNTVREAPTSRLLQQTALLSPTFHFILNQQHWLLFII